MLVCEWSAVSIGLPLGIQVSDRRRTAGTHMHGGLRRAHATEDAGMQCITRSLGNALHNTRPLLHSSYCQAHLANALRLVAPAARPKGTNEIKAKQDAAHRVRQRICPSNLDCEFCVPPGGRIWNCL